MPVANERSAALGGASPIYNESSLSQYAPTPAGDAALYAKPVPTTSPVYDETSLAHD